MTALVASIVEKNARAEMTKIIKSDCPATEKHEQLDALVLRTMNQHPDGWAAQIVREIQAADTEVLYPGWRGR
jgi:hypothetical protein